MDNLSTQITIHEVFDSLLLALILIGLVVALTKKSKCNQETGNFHSKPYKPGPKQTLPPRTERCDLCNGEGAIVGGPVGPRICIYCDGNGFVRKSNIPKMQNPPPMPKRRVEPPPPSIKKPIPGQRIIVEFNLDEQITICYEQQKCWNHILNEEANKMKSTTNMDDYMGYQNKFYEALTESRRLDDKITYLNMLKNEAYRTVGNYESKIRS